VYFEDGSGNLVFTAKADIWSAAVTIMHGFQGRLNQENVALEKVSHIVVIN